MKKEGAFTLIELLVVIGVSALLMSIMMPALSRARQSANSVVCQSNLRHWGTIFAMYADGNNGKFMKACADNLASTDPCDWRGLMWMGALRPYYGESTRFKKDDLRLCPTATRPANPPGHSLPPPVAPGLVTGCTGGKFVAWGTFDDSCYWLTPGDYGSYGINAWVYNPPLSYPDGWRGPNVKGANNIPLFLDSAWLEVWPLHTDEPPTYEGELEIEGGILIDNMREFCLNRHSGAVNGVFLDYSVRKIGLKKLWTLKWHRSFHTNGPWTKDYVPPPVWPDWMKKFRD